jgi:hypothetical protein
MDVFYGNPNLSPTDKAIIVAELADLGSTAGREIFIEGAANAQSIEMGFFYRRQAELIADYNKKVAKVNGFARLGAAPCCKPARVRSAFCRSITSIGRTAGEPDRRCRARRAVDHRPRQRESDAATCRARLDASAKGRRQTR